MSIAIYIEVWFSLVCFIDVCVFIRRSLERSCVVFIVSWFRWSWSAVLELIVLPCFY